MKKIALLGAGAWGTVISKMLAENGHSVNLWSYEEEVAVSINENRINHKFLPEVLLPPGITAFSSLDQVVQNAEAVVNVVIAKGLRDVLEKLPASTFNLPWLSATKGLEPETGQRISEIILNSQRAEQAKLAIISGPNLASEIARKSPASAVIGSESKSTALYFQELLMRPYFRLYSSADPLGVELGGALKNIIALAAGICDGLKIGDNGKAALISRGLAEIVRLAQALGAEKETLFGLSGLGDLVATCASPLSRNRWCGEELGKGRKIDEIIASTNSVVEGVRTTQAVVELAQKYDLDMPITQAVYDIVFMGQDPAAQVETLMNRMAKAENASLSESRWKHF